MEGTGVDSAGCVEHVGVRAGGLWKANPNPNPNPSEVIGPACLKTISKCILGLCNYM